MVAQVRYLVVGRSRRRVILCAVYTVHKETRSTSFLVESQNHWDGLSVVWPQNHWDSFFRFGLKISGDSFFWFGLKIGDAWFLSLGLKGDSYS
jgi:hypothetical protein